MEVMSILLGLIFWPAALITWAILCRRKKISKAIRVIGTVLLIGLPLLGAVSMGKWMFLDEPLFTAVQNGEVRQAKALLAKGADANVNFEGTTALEAATQAGNAEMIRLLQAHGAKMRK